MDYNQYVQLVKQRGAMTDDQEVERAIRSVLEVLSERLSTEKADDLGDVLPKELKPYIKKSGEAERFGLEEFLDRVGKKEGIDRGIAFHHAREVLSVLAAAVPTRELAQALSELPDPIRDLFMVEGWVKKAA